MTGLKLIQYLKFAFYIFITIGFSSSRADAYVDFFRALDLDDEQRVVALLQRGFDPNAPNPDGQPALLLALQLGSPKVARVLLEHPGLKLDATNPSGETAAMMAALRGEVAVMLRLLERGARAESGGWTVLHYAAAAPDAGAARALLARAPASPAPAIDALGPTGLTPLMMAARWGSGDTVELLMSLGADPTRRNPQGFTSVDYARGSGREWLVELMQRPRR